MTPQEIIAASKLPVSEEEMTKRAKAFKRLIYKSTIKYGEQSIRMHGFDWDTDYNIQQAKKYLEELGE